MNQIDPATKWRQHLARGKRTEPRRVFVQPRDSAFPLHIDRRAIEWRSHPIARRSQEVLAGKPGAAVGTLEASRPDPGLSAVAAPLLEVETNMRKLRFSQYQTSCGPTQSLQSEIVVTAITSGIADADS